MNDDAEVLCVCVGHSHTPPHRGIACAFTRFHHHGTSSHLKHTGSTSARPLDSNTVGGLLNFPFARSLSLKPQSPQLLSLCLVCGRKWERVVCLSLCVNIAIFLSPSSCQVNLCVGRVSESTVCPFFPISANTVYCPLSPSPLPPKHKPRLTFPTPPPLTLSTAPNPTQTKQAWQATGLPQNKI
ncbi:hypothetical protein ACTXT7_005090 [Hymenolepis weldensis]